MGELALVLFWGLFFRQFFVNPWRYATSDFVATYFSSWRYFGRQLRNRATLNDPYYFGNVWGFPAISTWYPPHLLTAWIGSFLPLNASFLFFSLSVFSHFLFASICSYYLFGNLLFAITLAYMMRAVNFSVCAIYTWAWIPFVFLMLQLGHPILAGIGLWIAFSGGYTPLLVYSLPFTLLWGFQPVAFIVAGVLSLPQVLATRSYMKKSIRSRSTYESKAIGSVPWWHFISLLWPLKLNLNGILYPELAYGIGRIALIMVFLTVPSLFLLSVCVLSVYFMLGQYVNAPILLRGPCRAGAMLSIALIFMASNVQLSGSIYTIALLLQSFDILINHSPLMLYEPFTHPGKKPSEWFNSRLIEYLKPRVGNSRVSGLPFPLEAGHITGIRGLGYCGGSMLKTDADYRNITDPNGCGLAHDWFVNADDDEKVDWYDILYAYKPCENLNPVKWQETPVRDLWLNKHLTVSDG